jgi:protein phosphatase
VSAETVRAAVAEADEAEQKPAAPAVTRPGRRPAHDTGYRVVVRPRAAGTRRDDTRLGQATLEGGVPRTSPIAARRAPPVSRRRRILAAISVVLVLVVAVVAVWLIARQFWFVGTDDRGQVALYRGLPYELPLGIDLYTQQDVSDVPAAAIEEPKQRNYVLDHHARGRGESEDLFRDIESNYSQP